MLRLTAPSIDLHRQFLTAHREWGEGLHEDGLGLTPHDDVVSATGFATWVRRLDSSAVNFWWVTDDEPAAPTSDTDAPRILGAIALRPTERSGDIVTGHIGYGVTPSARGQGIATWALRAVLAEAASRGMPACVLVCLADNAASIRTIERCGGQLESTVTDDEGLRRRIYRITLPPPVAASSPCAGEPGHGSL